MRISAIFFLFFFLSCKQKSAERIAVPFSIYPSEMVSDIKYAKGFTVDENDSLIILHVRSLSEKYPFKDSLIFAKKPFNGAGKIWQNNWQHLACQSATHLAFLDALDVVDKVVAASDIAFMPKDDLYDKIMAQKVVELNHNNTIDLEHLVSINPDLMLMYPFEWKSEKYQKVNVPTLLVSEYLEQTPIARLEWIKFFGLLVAENEKADSIFNTVKSSYESYMRKQTSPKTVFFNVPFKDVWDMPASNSITVNLLKDAGFNYLFDSNDNSTDNLSFDKETVWARVHNADYWVIIASRPPAYSLNDLIEEESVYSTFKAVTNKHVLFCNTNHSSYFTAGILEPHIMLKDLLSLTGQIKNHQPKYFQLLK